MSDMKAFPLPADKKVEGPPKPPPTRKQKRAKQR